MLGRDDRDPLFLQLKEAQASVLEPFLGKSAFSSHGQRVVEGQRLTQAASDILLGWIQATGLDGAERDFYVRQLWDGKGSAAVDQMNHTALTAYATLCGRAAGQAHARSGDAIAIAGYLGAATASTARWPPSPRPTPTRTTATSPPCMRPSWPVGWRLSPPRSARPRVDGRKVGE